MTPRTTARAPSTRPNRQDLEDLTGPAPEPRLAVHRDAPSRLGASHPRQEGPADLRLVPPALAAWGTAALMLHAPPSWAITVAVICVVLAAVLVLRARATRPARTTRPAKAGQGTRAARRAAAAAAGAAEARRPAKPRTRPPQRQKWALVSAAAALLCVAASASSAALHGADLRRGPVPQLARRYAHATLDVEVTSDPHRARPRVTGDHMAPQAVLLDGDAVRVTTAHAGTRTTRAPVLVIVDVPVGAAGDRGDGPDPAAGTAMGPRVPSAWQTLLPGTRVRVQARLAPALPGGDRIAAVVRVAGDTAPQVIRPPSIPQRWAGSLRDGLRTATRDLAPDARALLPGLVVGDTSRVPPELDGAFRATDLSHVLAVSGANFTVLLALLIGPPGLAHRAERRGLARRLGIGLRSTAVLGGVLALGFVMVCRPGPSVLRAAACGGIALLAMATGRRRSLIPALSAVVLLLVLYDPWLARSQGFLLSVLATGALLTVAPRWAATLGQRGLSPRLAEPLAAAAAAQAVCAPVLVVLASRVSLVAVPCNLLAELAVAPATVLGFGALIMAPTAMPVAKVLAWCAGWPAGWLAEVARTGANLPGCDVDWPGGWHGALLLLAVTAVVVEAGRRLIRHTWACLVCLCALALYVVQPVPVPHVLTGWPPSGWRFVMCDVGQGDATVLAAGDGSGVVVDAGPDPQLVDGCLRSLGITRIRLVLLTHFHADHVAGLAGVLRGRAVGAIETTGFREPRDQAEYVRRLAAARHIPVTRAVAGERRRTGALEWRVLWPPPRPAPQPDDPNDASVALLVRTGGLRLLLLGDLEPPAQQALLHSPAAAAVGRVDVLKVAHHGSAYQDPLLLRWAAPRLALISCGADNPYGHPSARTVAALQRGGATVLRTDEDGSLAVTGSAASGLRVAESSAVTW